MTWRIEQPNLDSREREKGREQSALISRFRNRSCNGLEMTVQARVDQERKMNRALVVAQDPGVEVSPLSPMSLERILSAKTMTEWWTLTDGSITQELSQLHWDILSFCRAYELTAHEVQLRKDALGFVERAVREQWPGAEVRLFGSAATGLSLPWSDIDVEIIMPPLQEYPGGKPSPLSWQKALIKSLNRLGQCCSLKKIPSAKVPVLKVVFNSGIACDISLGVQNSRVGVAVIRQFMSRYEACRPLCLVLKFFLGQSNLNDLSTGGLGSFCITTLVISHLQRMMGASFQAAGHDLGILLLSFFAYYSQMHDYSTDVVSTRAGFCSSKLEKGWVKPKHPQLLAVEDPLDPSSDIGKASHKIEEIRKKFSQAQRMLLTQWYRDCVLEQIVGMSVDPNQRPAGLCPGKVKKPKPGGKKKNKKKRKRKWPVSSGQGECILPHQPALKIQRKNHPPQGSGLLPRSQLDWVRANCTSPYCPPGVLRINKRKRPRTGGLDGETCHSVQQSGPKPLPQAEELLRRAQGNEISSKSLEAANGSLPVDKFHSVQQSGPKNIPPPGELGGAQGNEISLTSSEAGNVSLHGGKLHSVQPIGPKTLPPPEELRRAQLNEIGSKSLEAGNGSLHGEKLHSVQQPGRKSLQPPEEVRRGESNEIGSKSFEAGNGSLQGENLHSVQQTGPEPLPPPDELRRAQGNEEGSESLEAGNGSLQGGKVQSVQHTCITPPTPEGCDWFRRDWGKEMEATDTSREGTRRMPMIDIRESDLITQSKPKKTFQQLCGTDQANAAQTIHSDRSQHVKGKDDNLEVVDLDFWEAQLASKPKSRNASLAHLNSGGSACRGVQRAAEIHCQQPPQCKDVVSNQEGTLVDVLEPPLGIQPKSRSGCSEQQGDGARNDEPANRMLQENETLQRMDSAREVQGEGILMDFWEEQLAPRLKCTKGPVKSQPLAGVSVEDASPAKVVETSLKNDEPGRGNETALPVQGSHVHQPQEEASDVMERSRDERLLVDFWEAHLAPKVKAGKCLTKNVDAGGEEEDASLVGNCQLEQQQSSHSSNPLTESPDEKKLVDFWETHLNPKPKLRTDGEDGENCRDVGGREDNGYDRILVDFWEANLNPKKKGPLCDQQTEGEDAVKCRDLVTTNDKGCDKMLVKFWESHLAPSLKSRKDPPLPTSGEDHVQPVECKTHPELPGAQSSGFVGRSGDEALLSTFWEACVNPGFSRKAYLRRNATEVI